MNENLQGKFPNIRLRRTRCSDWSRCLVQENAISSNDLIWPIFVQKGNYERTSVEKMPGVDRLSIDLLIDEVAEAKALGIPAIALFPVVDQACKSENAEEAYNPDNLICRAVAEVKNKIPDIGVICDIALDPYTSHGQDGLVKDGYVTNDETVDLLCKQALCLAQAGCDVVAPSDMMDGRVGAIRNALDAESHIHTQIMSYAAKYASAFYGPFRDAVGSSGNLGSADKKTYQMDPANSGEALREIDMDISEGADMFIVKPGMPYLDIVKTVSDNFSVPIFAYQVSGEYAMIKCAAECGAFEEKEAFLESIMAFKRAGASGVLTYAAKDIVKWL